MYMAFSEVSLPVILYHMTISLRFAPFFLQQYFSFFIHHICLLSFFIFPNSIRILLFIFYIIYKHVWSKFPFEFSIFKTYLNFIDLFYFIVPSQPRDLRVNEIGETSIGLQWAKPNQVGEQILSYELYWNDTYAKVG